MSGMNPENLLPSFQSMKRHCVRSVGATGHGGKPADNTRNQGRDAPGHAPLVS